MVSMQQPPVGIPYIDPAFGTTVVRITDVSPSEGENAVIKPMYSTIQAWNADESLMILWHREVGHELYDGQTYQYIRTLPLLSPTDIEQVLWDPWDPDLLYYPTNYNALPYVLRYRVSTGETTVHADLSLIGCPVGDWGALLGLGSDPGGPAFMLPGVSTLGMRCGDRLIVFELTSGLAWSTRAPVGTGLAPIMAPIGTHGYIAGVEVDALLNGLRVLPLTNPYDHGSVGIAPKSMSSWYSVVFEETSQTGPASIVRTNLDTGAQLVVVGQANGWPYPPGGTHISAITRATGWVAASAVGSPSSAGSVPLHQEVFLANSDTGEVCRIAHHRSVAGEGPWGYWAEPHVTISPTGTRLLFGSDWGAGPVVNSYVIDLRR